MTPYGDALRRARRRRRRNAVLGALLAFLVLQPVVWLAATMGHGASVQQRETDCREALAANLRAHLANANLPPELGPPAACRDLDSATLTRLAGDAVNEVMDR
jgi:hypothetical protein